MRSFHSAIRDSRSNHCSVTVQVIAITDANFHRYGITAAELKKAMESNQKVKCSLIAIGEGAEVTWLPKVLPGKAYRVVVGFFSLQIVQTRRADLNASSRTLEI